MLHYVFRFVKKKKSAFHSISVFETYREQMKFTWSSSSGTNAIPQLLYMIGVFEIKEFFDNGNIEYDLKDCFDIKIFDLCMDNAKEK